MRLEAAPAQDKAPLSLSWLALQPVSRAPSPTRRGTTRDAQPVSASRNFQVEPGFFHGNTPFPNLKKKSHRSPVKSGLGCAPSTALRMLTTYSLKKHVTFSLLAYPDISICRCFARHSRACEFYAVTALNAEKPSAALAPCRPSPPLLCTMPSTLSLPSGAPRGRGQKEILQEKWQVHFHFIFQLP